MARPKFDPAIKTVSAQSYCPKCKITTFYPPNRPHLPKACDGILIDIRDKDNETTTQI